MAQQEEFQALFEDVAPQVIWTAVDYAQGDSRLETVWVFVTMENKVSSHAEVYRFDGKLVPIERLGADNPQFGDPTDAILAISESLLPLFLELEDQSQLPNSMTMRFDVATQAMDVEFSDEPLPRRPGETSGDYAARWAEEFRG